MTPLTTEKICIFWFRRDLRLEDNRGLFYALKQQGNVVPIFIFDVDILKNLPACDARVQFIHNTLSELKFKLGKLGSDLRVFHGSPLEIFKEILGKTKISAVYCNHDYEPAAKKRDESVRLFLQSKGCEFFTFKDQVIFEKNEIQKDSGGNYTVFTPYKKRWLQQLRDKDLQHYSLPKRFFNVNKKSSFPSLKDIGFKQFDFSFYPKDKLDKALLENYDKHRDFPAINATSHLGLHLRFGTISIRKAVDFARQTNPVWLSELIWREFYMQILDHNPRLVRESFKKEFDAIAWRNNKSEFARWCSGETGYPLVDAGMRELNTTGYMHNRVRMVTASFLTKHLLMHWLDGEKYFAEKLLDFDLSANNGNWQWAAGSGCDAAPYFRVFNPTIQQKKFDPDFQYIKKWVPEFNTEKYCKPIIDHVSGRERCLRAFAISLKGKK